MGQDVGLTREGDGNGPGFCNDDPDLEVAAQVVVRLAGVTVE